MKMATWLMSIGALVLVSAPASAQLSLQVDPLVSQGIGIKLTGTLAGPVPTFNQHILTIIGLNTGTGTPIEWITLQRTLTRVGGAANGMVSGASINQAVTGNNPLNGLGDIISIVFDQPLVAGATMGLENVISFSTTGVAAINPDGLSDIGHNLALYWGSEGGNAPTGTFQSFNGPPDPPLIGDLDGDGFVGIVDLNIVLGNWNLTIPPGHPMADPSGDDFVGIADLNVVLGNWNAGTPPPGAPGEAANIPEPGTLGLTAISLLSLARRTRR
jgi:hypothetical protein